MLQTDTVFLVAVSTQSNFFRNRVDVNTYITMKKTSYRSFGYYIFILWGFLFTVTQHQSSPLTLRRDISRIHFKCMHLHFVNVTDNKKFHESF